jgi:hypothetical protein
MVDEMVSPFLFEYEDEEEEEEPGEKSWDSVHALRLRFKLSSIVRFTMRSRRFRGAKTKK